jgi:hypothetical protein
MSKIQPVENDKQHKVRISTGKPSLRLRLEAYYGLVSPDQLLGTDWLTRFELIWDKYGGTDEGEAKLASKLEKKYGKTVRFLTAAKAVSRSANTAAKFNPSEDDVVYPEESFALATERTGVIDFLSNRFDPLAALQTSSAQQVTAANSWMSGSSMLNRVDEFRPLLPTSDPMYRPATVVKKRDRAEKPKAKPPSSFAAVAEPFETGPLSTLFKAFMKRQRIRVVVRYVNSIRGTITGYLIAFDKHVSRLESARSVSIKSHITCCR